jgi:hypothetical protein
MPPHLKCREGDVVYVRGIVTSAESDAFHIRFEHGNIIARAWVPSEEVAKREDIDDLAPVHEIGVATTKLPKLVARTA